MTQGDDVAQDRGNVPRSAQPGRGERSDWVAEESGPAPGPRDGRQPGGLPGGLSQAMDELARSLQGEHASVEDTLQAITAAAVRGVPGVELGGVTLVSGRRSVQNRAATDPVVEQLDEVQARLGEGPCLSAIWQQRTVRVDDMAVEQRWPRFAAAASDLGVGSSLSFQLFVEGDNLGALNLYASTPHAFDSAAEDYGLPFATHAAVALIGAQHESQLRAGMDTRDVIGMAKGILIERFTITPDAAFLVLARLSQNTNIKLHDIADHIVSTGQVHAPPAVNRKEGGTAGL